MISVGGGFEPQWSANGRTLYYLANDNTLMAVAVDTGATLRVDAPRPLFRTPVSGYLTTYRGIYRSHFAVTADDKRFLIAADEEEQPPISVIVDWPAMLARNAVSPPRR